MNTPLCERPNCDGRPYGSRRRHVSAAGLRLCAACHREIETDLHELPKIHSDCASALPRRRDPALQRVSGSRQASGVLLDEDAMSARSNVLGVLASWCALVADERRMTKPGRRHPAHLTAFLIRHLNWLLAHPAAADFADEISQITAQAQRAAYTRPAAQVVLGQCVHPDCSAPLTPSSRNGGRSREISCTGGHTWQPHEWLQLFRRQPDDDWNAPTERPAEDIA